MKKVRQRRLNRLNIAAIILLSICFGAVISNSPQVVKAFSIIVQKIINFEDGSIGFLFGSPSSPASREETEEQHISMEGVERHEVRVEEIRQLNGVQLPNLAFLSKEFTVRHAWLYDYKSSNQNDKLRIQVSEIGSDQIINLNFSLLGEDELLVSGGNEGSIEEHLIHGRAGYLSPAGEGRYSMEFVVNSIHVMIIGELSRERIIELSDKIIASE